ncbi:Alpha-2,8-sialyltransferase 8F [Pelobates cultripes]|uniref:Alpha-2,8-sialyltransferase 8F, partial n=1 Tax=Pelobates cultripes TaxID=61616 RepID=A0AAD1RJ91_PELCU|nr:Alpha-2,8-sialyltransferase 8F [Pelobates cultripes]
MAYKRCRIMNLIIISILFVAFYSFYRIISDRVCYCPRAHDQSLSLPEESCQQIRNSIILTKLKNYNKTFLMEQINELQSCQWLVTGHALKAIRSELRACCNAGSNLLVTQANTHIGDYITYGTNRDKRIEVTENIHEMLPKVSPFPDKPFRRCSVVGNGGILLNSGCGSDIDQADFVFRFNLPPMNYAGDIGTKTDLVTANPSILHTSYSKLDEERKPFIDDLKAYKSALIVMPAFSFTSNVDVSFKVFHTLQDFESQQKVAYFHPDYLKNLALYWINKGLTARRLSSGLIIVSTALELCDEVTLYGFWPFSRGATGKPISHRYYDNKVPKPGFHSMPDEFFFYTQMHSKGILRLKIGTCY